MHPTLVPTFPIQSVSSIHTVCIKSYSHALLNDGDMFREMCHQAISLCEHPRVTYTTGWPSLLHTWAVWWSLLL